MQYAVVELVRLVRHESGRISVWQEMYGEPAIAIAIHANAEMAHTWLVNEGYESHPDHQPNTALGGLHEYYYRLIPVVML